MNQLVYLGLGTNIGDRDANLFTAIAALDVRDEISVNRTASIYETDPLYNCLLYTSPSPRDRQKSRMPSSA